MYVQIIHVFIMFFYQQKNKIILLIGYEDKNII